MDKLKDVAREIFKKIKLGLYGEDDIETALLQARDEGEKEGFSDGLRLGLKDLNLIAEQSRDEALADAEKIAFDISLEPNKTAKRIYKAITTLRNQGEGK